MLQDGEWQGKERSYTVHEEIGRVEKKIRRGYQ